MAPPAAVIALRPQHPGRDPERIGDRRLDVRRRPVERAMHRGRADAEPLGKLPHAPIAIPELHDDPGPPFGGIFRDCVGVHVRVHARTIDQISGHRQAKNLVIRARVAMTVDQKARQAFAERLSMLRADFGSAQKLAHLTGFGKTTVQNWINGISEPDVTDAVRLADALGVNLSWLAAGRGDMHAHEGDLPKTRAFDIDSPLLEAAIAAVEEWLEKRRLTLSPADKARAVKLVMVQAGERGGHIDAMGVDGIVRVIAYAG